MIDVLRIRSYHTFAYTFLVIPNTPSIYYRESMSDQEQTVKRLL